jgi:hypothetical protein
MFANFKLPTKLDTWICTKTEFHFNIKHTLENSIQDGGNHISGMCTHKIPSHYSVFFHKMIITRLLVFATILFLCFCHSFHSQHKCTKCTSNNLIFFFWIWLFILCFKIIIPTVTQTFTNTHWLILENKINTHQINWRKNATL